MTDPATLYWTAFGAVSSLVLMVFLLMGGRKNRLDTRLRDLASKGGTLPDSDPIAGFAQTALPKMGASLVPKNEAERTRLQLRLIHAGLYGRQDMLIFLGVKLLLVLGPPLIGVAVGLAGIVPVIHGLMVGAVLGMAGMIGPSFWLDRKKAGRQTAFRRALPDALDVLVICLEGGLSLTGALRRLATELKMAHPLLAAELRIVQREVQLGRAPGVW